MKKKKQCSKCFFLQRNVQIDMGAHSDVCLFYEEKNGLFNGFLDNYFGEDEEDLEECEYYFNEKDVFKKIYELVNKEKKQ